MITTNNLATEYPKLKIKLPDALNQEQFEKTVKTYMPLYDKHEAIQKRVDLFVEKLNEAVKAAAKDKPKQSAQKSKPGKGEKAGEKPQNLTQLKKYLKPGMKLWWFMKVPNGWSQVNVGRPIAKVQNNGISLKTERGTESWLYWPKASNFKFTKDGFSMHQQGGGYVMYYFYEDQQKNIEEITGMADPIISNPKKKTSKSKRKSAKVKKPETVKIESWPEDIRLIRRFYNALDKERSRATILRIYRDFEKRVTERKVRKDDPNAEVFSKVHNLLARSLAKLDDELTHITLHLSSDGNLLKQIEKLAKAMEVRTSVNLLKRFIGMEGELNPDKTKVKRLLQAIDNALDKGKVKKDDIYYDEVQEARKALYSFTQGIEKGIKVEQTALHGLQGITGLGK